MAAVRLRVLVALVLIVPTSVAHAETLQTLLAANRISVEGFTASDLSADVNAAIGTDSSRSLVAFRKVHGDIFEGPLTVVSFDKHSRKSERHEIADDDKHICTGSPLAVTFADHFALVSIHINPSAECTLVVDKLLQLRHTLYGFGPVRVGRNQVVLTESMVHFAPYHAERLQWVDLQNGERAEVYPPQGDPLRAHLAEKNKQGMPSQAICAEMNDPCDPALFDESLENLASDGNRTIAFIAHQSAAHAVKAGQPPEEVASQDVLYVLRRGPQGWDYCEEELNETETRQVAKELKSTFTRAASRCMLSTPVVPDGSTPIHDPFPDR